MQSAMSNPYQAAGDTRPCSALVDIMGVAQGTMQMQLPQLASSAHQCRQEPDTTITDVVYLDVGYCPAGANQNRTLGESAVCKTTDALGRIVIGGSLIQPPYVPLIVSTPGSIAKGPIVLCTRAWVFWVGSLHMRASVHPPHVPPLPQTAQPSIAPARLLQGQHQTSCVTRRIPAHPKMCTLPAELTPRARCGCALQVCTAYCARHSGKLR